MQNTTFINNWDELRFSFFYKIRNAGVVQKIGFALIWAVVTGVLAQVRIPLPWTPIPITGQTFAVMLSGVVLGSFWGGMSQVLYIVIGLIGIPWFQGMKGGITAFFGPTGGYLIGFILTALAVGYVTDNFPKVRKFFPMSVLLICVYFPLTFIPGLLQLAIWMKMVKGSFPTFFNLLMMGFLPFVVGDLLKIGTASFISKIFTPKRDLFEKK